MSREYEIENHPRPTGALRDELVSIARELTASWFTPNVPGDLFLDLGFQDAYVLKQAGRVVSFIVYTCIDGSIQIMLMGTRPDQRGNGYGSVLLNEFFRYIQSTGYSRVTLYTVPPDTKPAYTATLAFYQKHGFVLRKRYNELWESGALELVKKLS